MIRITILVAAAFFFLSRIASAQDGGFLSHQTLGGCTLYLSDKDLQEQSDKRFKGQFVWSGACGKGGAADGGGILIAIHDDAALGTVIQRGAFRAGRREGIWENYHAAPNGTLSFYRYLFKEGASGTRPMDLVRRVSPPELPGWAKRLAEPKFREAILSENGGYLLAEGSDTARTTQGQAQEQTQPAPSKTEADVIDLIIVKDPPPAATNSAARAAQGQAQGQTQPAPNTAQAQSSPDDSKDGLEAYRRGDYPTALRLLLPLAEKGDATAQSTLGAMYRSGTGVPRDIGQAGQWYFKAAQQGDAEAQFWVGAMSFTGRGMDRDSFRAYVFFELAANKGHRRAAMNRDEITGFLTPGQIAQAQKLAREWKPVSASGKQ